MNLPMGAFGPLQKILNAMRKSWRRFRKRRADFGAYNRWLTNHPSSTFKEFYVHTIMGHLVGEGGRHSTLGADPIWEKQGEEVLLRLTQLGLRPSDVVVDYGCGTLREGIHLIRYLDTGRYIGLDIDERILSAGRRLLGQELLAEKQPHLAIINPSLITQVAAAKPAWIVSSYVLSQMPPEDLDEYFDNLAKLAEGGGKAALQVRLAWRTMQYSKTGWCHNRRRMARRLAERGFEILQMRTCRFKSKPYKVQGLNVRFVVRRIAPQNRSAGMSA